MGVFGFVSHFHRIRRGSPVLCDGRTAEALRPSFRCFAIAAVVVVIPFVVVTDHADLPRWAVVVRITLVGFFLGFPFASHRNGHAEGE